MCQMVDSVREMYLSIVKYKERYKKNEWEYRYFVRSRHYNYDRREEWVEIRNLDHPLWDLIIQGVEICERE